MSFNLLVWQNVSYSTESKLLLNVAKYYKCSMRAINYKILMERVVLYLYFIKEFTRF